MRAKRIKRRKFLTIKEIGCILICLTVLFLAKDIYDRFCFESHTTTEKNEMKRQETVSGFYSLGEFESYLTKALEDQNLDSFLRVCAIDERSRKYSFTYIMQSYSSEKFTYNGAYLPAGSYEEYQPVNSMLFTSEFIDQYNQLMDQLCQESGKKNIEIKIKNIKILQPEKQLERDYLKTLTHKCNRWYADFMIDLIATVRVAGNDYVFGITVARYDNYYKIFKLQANLLEWDDDVYVMNKKDVDYSSLISKVDEDEFVQQMDNLLADDGLEYEVDQVDHTVSDPENAILPLNYMLVDSEYGETPNQVITQFLMELIRHNPKKALNYCQIYEDSDTLEDMLLSQGDFAKQLSYLYKGLADLPYAVTIGVNYNYLDFTSNELVDMLSPDEMHTMSIHSIGEAAYGNEYVVLVDYNTNSYRMGFTLKETEKGWKIVSLSAYRIGISQGEVVKIEESSETGEEDDK